MTRSAVVDRPIDVAQLIAEVSHVRYGAVATFVGTVRNVHDGRAVTALEYSAYESMAESELRRIMEEACGHWAGCTIVVEHRVGTLALGDVAVAIAAAHEHRGPAFDACRYVIEQLKQRVPMWKREHYADGTREWVDPSQGSSTQRSQTQVEPRSDAARVDSTRTASA